MVNETKGQSTAAVEEIEALVAKARAKLSPAELEKLRATWAADDEAAARKREAEAAEALAAARKKARDAIAALRRMDPDAAAFVQSILAGA